MLDACVALIVIALLLTIAASAEGKIDRHALVTRHNIVWNDAQGQIPLGNGEFAFNSDGTGLQTFGGSTMAHWAWHSFPLPEGVTADQIPITGTYTQGHPVGGDVFPPERAAITNWMINNPHKFNLARIRLHWSDGRDVTPDQITDLTRTLDLWTGLQTSTYKLDGVPVAVVTCVHPKLDMVAIRIVSQLVTDGRLEVAIDFPYPNLDDRAAWVGDFEMGDRHETRVAHTTPTRADFHRRIDAVTYNVGLSWSSQADLREPATATDTRSLTIRQAEYGSGDTWVDVTEKIVSAAKDDRVSLRIDNNTMGGDPTPGVPKRLKVSYALDREEHTVEVLEGAMLRIQTLSFRHTYHLTAKGSDTLELACAFATGLVQADLPTFAESKAACADRWRKYWSTGGAIDLSGSKDPRWMELERRIVLSQYHMAAHSSGSYPSPESGLIGIDPWHGTFHMEMVWWHLAHYALWDRWSMAEKALTCYTKFAPPAGALAAQVGSVGLKWPKAVGPEGRSMPWYGNLALLWKQPHPMFFAELDYRLHPTQATLDKWFAIIQGTADHMADYPTLDPATGLYSLTPNMPPSEQGITHDTVFDLAYWRWGLDKAQEWRERMGLPREPRWDEVRSRLVPLPTLDGVFIHSPEWTDTYTKRAWEHPDPVGVLGMLPPIDGVDPEIAHRTVLKVWETWNWKAVWGWDFPWMAMAAARVGEPQIAVEALLRTEERNAYDIRGVNTGGPCPYIPGNGGLLYAVAMMAAGWDGAPDRPNPGFPTDGSWSVKWEGLKRAP